MYFIVKSRRNPLINIIPLIDVLVVLLIFYIATTVFKTSQPSLPIHLAISPQATNTSETHSSILTVTADDKVFLDHTPVDLDQLGALLKSKIAADPSFTLAMNPDTKMTFGTLTRIMTATHAAGIGDLKTFMNLPKAAGS